MRISNDRYSRDRLRYDLAVRFIDHEARTHTISDWTGLTEDRIRKLFRAYLGEGPQCVRRLRGKSPHLVSFFMRSPQRKYESSILASLCCLFGVVPRQPAPDAERTLPDVLRGTALCQAYEAFRVLLPASPITFEHTVLLVKAVARGEELRIIHCTDCGGVVVADKLSVRDPRCGPCIGRSPPAC